MHVAAGRRFGSVHVGMRVDPKQADLLTLPAIELSDARNRASCDRMISTQHKRNLAGFKRLKHHLSALGTSRGDFLEIFGVGCAFLLLLRNGDGDVAGIFDNVADSFEAGFESSDADGGRTHVDAAAGLAEVERNADDTNLTRTDAAERRGSQRHESVLSSQLSVISSRDHFLQDGGF